MAGLHGPEGSMRSFIRDRRMCDWENFAAREDFARQRLEPDASDALPPFLLLSEPGFSAGEQRICAENWMRARVATATIARETLGFARPRAENAKIRLGYLSNDFHDHATSMLLIETLEAHDRSQFELHAYSYGADDGKTMRQRLDRTFDSFNHIGALTDIAAAQAIHDAQIDILIDLKGFTQGTRTSILALRPAPVQVNYLGYPGTLGDNLCDYLITDDFVTPNAAAADYAEAFAFMPHSYQPHGCKGSIGPAPTRAEAGLPEEGFVFCCFNQAFKLTPEVFAIWIRLLAQAPGSVLWLLAMPEAEGNLRSQAIESGLDPRRIVFAPDMGQSEHLSRLQLADLVLDTAPYGAHTTASDALWVGAPVLTSPGATFASRVAGSLLRAVGLSELIVANDEDYFELALALATDKARFDALRAKLALNRTTAPLFDVSAYTLALEQLYRVMNARSRAGLPLAMIDSLR